MSEPGTGTGRSTLDLERLVYFSDAVFAIVITILVLPLTSEVDFSGETGGLAQEVWELWPAVVSFVVSFLVVGQFWIAHHRMYGFMLRCDEGLLRVNLLTLLTVSFMPFPAALLGQRSSAEDAFPVVFYAASMTLTSIALTFSWRYALRRRLIDESADPDRVREGTVRGLVTAAVFVASIAVAFLGLLPAVLMWLVVLPVARNLAARRQRLRVASPDEDE